MGIVLIIHRILGEMILPLLIVIAAIYLTVTWKPSAPPSPVARLFPALVGIQVLLGIIWWVFGIVQGNPLYLSFPFILHPIIGLVAGGFTGAAQRRGLFSNLGRWAPLAQLGVLLLLVLANVAIAMMAT
jgi:heme A synthase